MASVCKSAVYLLFKRQWARDVQMLISPQGYGSGHTDLLWGVTTLKEQNLVPDT